MVYLFIMLWLLPVSLDAAWIQYREATMDVEGASESQPDPIPGYGLIEVSGPVEAILWPTPAGCPANSGQASWTHIDDVGAVTAAGGGMSVRTGLLFFHTTSPLMPGCHQVNSWKDLRDRLRVVIIQSIPPDSIVDALNYHFGWYNARCYNAQTNATCVQWLAQLDQTVTMYPSRPQGLAVATDMAVLVTEAMAFKQSQCVSQPGGPFC